MRRKKIGKRLKIVGATSTAIFSLATVFTATYAWFATNISVSATDMSLMVLSSSTVSITNVKLVKFNYERMIGAEDLYDYLQPDRGRVANYDYSDGSFGTNEIMNAYDPVEKILKGNSFDLTSMNCNALYEVTFTPPSSDLILQLTAKANGELADRGIGEISMLECADIDIFFEDDLNSRPNTYQEGVAYAAESVVSYNDALYVCTSATDDDENTEFEDESWQIIEEFDSGHTYYNANSHTDYVLHNNLVYKCKSGVYTGDASFFPAHWQTNGNQPTAFDPAADYSLNSYVLENSKCYAVKADISGGTYNSFSEVLGVTPSIVTEVGDFDSSLSYKVGDPIYTEINDQMVLCLCTTTIGGLFKQNEWDVFDNYSTSATYTKDFVVVKNGVVYSCVDSVSSQSFVETDWRPLLFGDVFYPSYDVSMTDPFEVLYYKASYLSSKKQQHKHFYFADNSWNSSHWNSVAGIAPSYAADTAYEINDVVINSEKYYQCISPMTELENTEFDKTKWKEIKTFNTATTYSYNDYVLYNDALYKCNVRTINALDAASISIPANLENDDSPLKIYINVNYAPSQLDDYYEKIYSSSIKVYSAIFDFFFDFDFQEDNG